MRAPLGVDAGQEDMRSNALETVLRKVQPPRTVRRTCRRMARAALRHHRDLSENTWRVVVLTLAERSVTHASPTGHPQCGTRTL